MVSQPSFWWRSRPTIAAVALWPASLAWGAIVARRMRRPPRLRPPVPVICVGNYSSGGEGKTPTALALAAIAREEGLSPGFLTRGYGGSTRGPVLVDPARHGADRVGDEALLLAGSAPTVVARDRAAGAPLLLAAGVDAIIMDDGFQNPSLAKDLSVIVADAATGIGNRLVMPAGPLRAPLRAQLQATDVLLVIGDGGARAPLTRLAARAGRRVIRGWLRPVEPAGWDRSRVLAFAGIGRPEKFFAALESAGAHFAGRVAFPDHHAVTAAEAASLLDAKGGDVRLVTTEKDIARLAGSTGVLAELRERAEIFRVCLVFEDPAVVRLLVKAAVDRARSDRGA